MLRVFRLLGKYKHRVARYGIPWGDEGEDEDDQYTDGIDNRTRFTANDYMHNKEGSDEDDVDERSNAKFQHYDDEDDVAGKCGWDLGIRTFPPNQHSTESFSFRNTILDADGDVCYYWMGVVSLAVLYNIAVMILRLAFSDMREMVSNECMLFYLADLTFDFIYLLDIALQFRIAYYEDGCLVLDPKKIAPNYRHDRRFKLDLMAIMPVHSLGVFVVAFLKFFFLDISSIYAYNVYIPLSRIPRLFKAHTLIRFFQITDSRTSNPNTVRAFKLTLYLWLVIHWIGCIYYMLSEYEGRGSNEWVYPNGTEFDHFSRKYIRCLYWSMLILTTIGERPSPQTDLEYVFTGMTFIIGVFVFAAVVGNVGDVISNMNASRQDFQARMDQIKFYMHHRNVPEGLQNRVKKWAEYTWIRTQAMDEPHILQWLPDRLRTQIAIQVHLDTLKKVTIFKECEEGLLRELVLKLKPQIYSPGDYICHKGEIGREMFIINHGKVEIVVPGQEKGTTAVVATLTSGNFFGEISLLKLDEGQNRRTADVKAVGYSELLCLSRKDLMTALVEYPNAKKILETQARERMQKMKEMRNEPSSSKDEGGNSEQPKKKKDWFLDVIKSNGFQKLITNRGSEISELKSVINDMKKFMGQVQTKASSRTNAEYISLESQLKQKDLELEKAKARIRELETSLARQHLNRNSHHKVSPKTTKDDIAKKALSRTTNEVVKKTKPCVPETRINGSNKPSYIRGTEPLQRSKSTEISVTKPNRNNRNQSKLIERSRSSERPVSNPKTNIDTLKSFRNSNLKKSEMCCSCNSIHSSDNGRSKHCATTGPANQKEVVQNVGTSSGYSSDTETLTLNTLLQVSKVLHAQAKDEMSVTSDDENSDDDDSSGVSDENEDLENILSTQSNISFGEKFSNDLRRTISLNSSLAVKETNV